MDRDGFEGWLRRYFDAWVSNDAGEVAGLFTDDVVYAVGPFREGWVGRDEIVRRWTSGPQDDVRTSFDVIAVEGDVGVAHWNVSAVEPRSGARSEWDGILVIAFGVDGRCRDHREWYERRVLP